jgi:hypothetical protein
MRVERNIDGFTLPEPLLVPLQVGSFGAQSPGGEESEVLAMTATIDIDQLPGLRAAFEKHHAGTLLDITAQWHMAVPGDTTVAPLAFLHLEIEEFKLSFDIIFDVDEHQRSLAAAARTGKLTLFEPELGGALRIEAPQEALRRLMSLGVMTGDTEPLRRVLHQRFDLPFTSRPVPRQVVGPGEAPDSLDEFLVCGRGWSARAGARRRSRRQDADRCVDLGEPWAAARACDERWGALCGRGH